MKLDEFDENLSPPELKEQKPDVVYMTLDKEKFKDAGTVSFDKLTTDQKYQIVDEEIKKLKQAKQK